MLCSNLIHLRKLKIYILKEVSDYLDKIEEDSGGGQDPQAVAVHIMSLNQKVQRSLWYENKFILVKPVSILKSKCFTSAQEKGCVVRECFLLR